MRTAVSADSAILQIFFRWQMYWVRFATDGNYHRLLSTVASSQSQQHHLQCPPTHFITTPEPPHLNTLINLVAKQWLHTVVCNRKGQCWCSEIIHFQNVPALPTVEINRVRSYTSQLAGALRAPCNCIRTLGTISSYLYTLSCTATYNN